MLRSPGMDLVVGVDAGGTATRAVVATLTGEVVGRGTSGPGNPIAVGSAAAAAALCAAVRGALAGVAPSRVVAGVVGVAGASRLGSPEVALTYGAAWSALGLPCPMQTHGDAVVAFAAGTPSPDGTVLIAGTGAVAASIAGWRVARTADGLGWLLGDEGSGWWLGVQALRAAVRSSTLTSLVCAHAGVTTRDALIGWAHAAPRGDIAALAPVVCAAARSGDPDAARLVRDAASRLIATLDELGPPAGPVVLAGGLLVADTPVRHGVVSALRERGTSTLTGRDAAAGAAWLAAHSVRAGHPPH